MKWVEFLKIYTFVLRHKSGNTNRVAGALSQRVSSLGTTIVKSTRLESIKANYELDEDFFDAWKESKDPWSVDITPYLDQFIQEGYVFKGH